MSKNLKTHDVIIIGAGPAGIGAALSLHHEGVDFAILEYSAPGGKINVAPRVDNYPGYTKIPGPDLAFAFYERLLAVGIQINGEEVISLTKEGNKFKIETDQNIYEAKAVLVASGAQEKKLGLPKEEELFGKGISYCALCDGHFFKDQTVVVVGGGNSALKESLHLAGLVKKLYLVHRRREFRGLNKFVKEIEELGNVEILTPYIATEIIGDDQLKALRIQNVETDEIKILEVDGFFPLVGLNPNTTFVKIEGILDDYRYIPVDNKTMMSPVEGLFAAGDVLPRIIKQIYLSEHDGKVAAKSIIEYLKK
ncbi:MAG: FAD-dependent oxidoreductase [Bacilli bacterium]